MEQQIWTPTCQPRPAHVDDIRVTIICRVCGTSIKVPLSNDALLCNVCRADHVLADVHLQQRIEAARQQFDDVVAQVSPADRERYAVVCRSVQALQTHRRNDASYRASVERRLAAARMAGDGLSTLLAAASHLSAELHAVEQAREELAWAEICRTSV